MNKPLYSSDEHQIKKYCAELINGKFYCFYNKKQKDDYGNICNYFDIISNRLSEVGYKLEKSESNKTIYTEMLAEMPMKYLNLNIIKSKVVLHLIKQFLCGIKDVNASAVIYYKWNELLKDLQEAYKNNKEKSEIIDILWILKSLGIIDINTTKSVLKDNDENDQIVISIFPSIRCICDCKDIDEVEAKLESYVANKQTKQDADEEDVEEDNIDE